MRCLLIGLVLLAGCDFQLRLGTPKPPVCETAKTSPYSNLPPVDLPVDLRQPNYRGGSCNHASMISVLRWQGRHKTADWWRQHYAGGASVHRLAGICNKIGIDYVMTYEGDEKVLEWASETRRGAAIHYFSNHAVTFAGYTGPNAILIDNNHPKDLIRIPKATFIRRWHYYGGCALVPVFSPSPPRPWS